MKGREVIVPFYGEEHFRQREQETCGVFNKQQEGRVATAVSTVESKRRCVPV